MKGVRTSLLSHNPSLLSQNVVSHVVMNIVRSLSFTLSMVENRALNVMSLLTWRFCCWWWRFVF